jgi:proline-specific peptidase
MLASKFSRLSLLVSAFAVAVVAVPTAGQAEGYVPFPYEGETYKTWYKVIGNLKSSSTPVVVLHGGPGLSHDYLAPFEDLATKYNRPVVLYDQVGNARSTHLDAKPSSFWTIDLFADELQNLLTHLSIDKSFDLVGHSWGGILASEFEVRRQPAGLKHLVLTSTPASVALQSESHLELLKAFPEDVQQGFIGGLANPAAFYNALTTYYSVHAMTLRPIPYLYNYTLETVFGSNGDLTVASAPILQDWSIVDRVGQISRPTLITNGKEDIVQDFVVQPFVKGIPNAQYVKFQKSSHSAFWEERDGYFKVLNQFLSK